MTVLIQPTRIENQPPEAQDQDVSINGNNPIKIKLGAMDPDDVKLRFMLVSKPSHGRIVQFSSLTGTLAYVPDENYNGKDDFAFKVHGTVFSNDAKVSIKIENNVNPSNDQIQQKDQQQKKDESSKAPTNEQKPNDQKSNSDTPPSDSTQQSSPSTQDPEQQKKDQKVEEPSPPQNAATDSGDVPSGDGSSTSSS